MAQWLRIWHCHSVAGVQPLAWELAHAVGSMERKKKKSRRVIILGLWAVGNGELIQSRGEEVDTPK